MLTSQEEMNVRLLTLRGLVLHLSRISAGKTFVHMTQAIPFYSNNAVLAHNSGPATLFQQMINGLSIKGRRLMNLMPPKIV